VLKPFLVYGSETWPLTEMDVKRLNAWETKILNGIYGSVVERGIWRIRTNQELRKPYKDLDTVLTLQRKD
jgi:hypothetical protein